jgi:integrase
MPRQRQTEYIEVQGKEAVIFQRGDIWYMRIQMPGSGEYHRASCRTSSKAKAVKMANKKYFGYDAMADAGIVVTRRKMGDLIDQMVANMERLVKIKQLSPHMLIIYRSKANVLRTYWAKWMPGEVTSHAWDEYIIHRLENGKSHHEGEVLSPVTLRHERMTMKKVLEVAQAEKLITHLPMLKSPVQKEGTGIRPSFEANEMELLELFLYERAGQPDDPYYFDRYYLLIFIEFMRFTGLRTNDVRLLKRWDITIEKRPSDGRAVLFIHATGKAKDRIAVSQPEAVEWLQKLHDHIPYIPRDGMLFPNKTGTGPKKFDGIMRRTLKAIKLLKDHKGRDRSPYSLRHFYAMSKINRGINIHDVAENMGCRIKVLERYYASHQKAMERLDQRSA